MRPPPPPNKPTPALLILALILVGLALGGCDVDLGLPTPTASPLDDSPTLAASPTVLPFMMTPDEEGGIGRSEPTSAALAAEGQPSEEAPFIALPTEASIPLIILSADNTRLNGMFQSADRPSAPAILILHAEDGDLSTLTAYTPRLKALGYHVLLLEYRGYGRSAGDRDWNQALEDTMAALNSLASLPNVTQLGIMADGRSASAALLACYEHIRCGAVVLYDPLPDESLLAFADLPTRVGAIPTLILAAQDRPIGLSFGQEVAAIKPNTALQTYASLSDFNAPLADLIGWLNTQLPPN